MVARRAGMGPGLAACGVVRHRLGPCCPIARAAACCCRSSARPMAKRWKRARSSFATIAAEGSFSAWYFEHRLPIAPERYSEILRSDRQGGRRRGRPRRARPCSIWRRATRDCAIPIASEAPAFKAELKDIAGAADIIARGLDAYRAGPDRAAQITGAASSAGTPALQARPLAAGLQRHQLPALFRRQYAGRIAGRGCRHLRGHASAWSKG